MFQAALFLIVHPLVMKNVSAFINRVQDLGRTILVTESLQISEFSLNTLSTSYGIAEYLEWELQQVM